MMVFKCVLQLTLTFKKGCFTEKESNMNFETIEIENVSACASGWTVVGVIGGVGLVVLACC